MIIRRATEADAAAIVQLHFDAVHITASARYEQNILDEWSKPVAGRLDQMREQLRVNKDQTDMFICELDGQPAGFGELASRTNEVRAVYVSPEFSGKGVGKALLKKLEEAARNYGLKSLWLDSSLNAAPFYASQGFEGDVEGEHILRSGQKMSCIKMQKQL